MSNNKHTLIPKLRFPEFQNEGEWEVKKLGEIIEFVRNGLNINQTNEKEGYKVTRIETISEGRINIEKVGYIRTLQDIAEYKLLIGDMLFSNINSVAHIGKIAFIDKDYDLYHGMNLLNIRINQDEHCPKFYFYQLTNCRLKRYFEEICNKAVNQASINQTDLKKTELAFPSLPEQQKIASCLSSIDEVITGEQQKLELLKQHKKGLLQNLFPQEGETVPKIRFKEFENSGEWEVNKLGEVFKSFSGGTPDTSKKEYYNGKIPFIRSAEIGKDSTELFITETGLENSSAKMVKKGDLLVALYGANSGEVAISKIDGAINQAILCFQSEYSNEFTYHFLSGKKNWIVSKYVQGGQGNLSGEIVKSISLPFPSKSEQQKIAACLSSLDEFITAQTQKIEQLQRHKKGLLQGLFPNINNE
jgi:type I restriction enzyme S subunit